MDVLNPKLTWIDGRCYRLPVVNLTFLTNNFSYIGKDENLENVLLDECDATNFKNDNIEEEIEKISENIFQTKFCVPQTFWPVIIGSKGVTKKRIETETKTTIIVPKPMEQGDIVIKGTVKKNIRLAKININAIVSSYRQKLPFTHFISLHITNDQIIENFINFKHKVLLLCGDDRGVEESLFQNPNKLHLTIATLTLVDQNERKDIEKKLNEVYENKIKPLISSHTNNWKIVVKGIEYMNDDPFEVDVLYAKIDSQSDRGLLQKIANVILECLIYSKHCKAENLNDVKLHITLMNTLFREEESQEVNVEVIGLKQNKWVKKMRKTFNATNILKEFQEYYFGEQEIKAINLSVRFSTSENGYYKSSYVLHL